MLNACLYKDRVLKFVDQDPDASKNIFTVIVGRNGTGKSTLLKSIVEYLVDPAEIEGRPHVAATKLKASQTFGLKYDSEPDAVIGISTNPFDKFPLVRYRTAPSKYEYLGLRGLRSDDLSLAFMARTFGALLRSVLNNRERTGPIIGVLDYLGYQGHIEASLVPEINNVPLNRLLTSKNPIEEIKRLSIQTFSWEVEKAIATKRLIAADLINSLRRWVDTSRQRHVNLLINAAGAFDQETGKEVDQGFLSLFELGFFRLINVAIRKREQDRAIRISDASSGEQCVTMALLGVASHIQDGALVCIDEPETCLHPEWQEKYIELFSDAFRAYSRCHFVIATHSPQIVSKLYDTNSFVLDLEAGRTVSATNFNKRSADFQLASLFRAPGYKNEYLSREILNALELIAAGHPLASLRQEELNNILRLKDLLNEDDPVKKMMQILESSLRELEQR